MSSRRRSGDEQGVTLVELLTVMAVSAVILAFVGRTVEHALGAQRSQTAQVGALNDTKLAFERVTRDIRGADPLREAALDRITLDLREAGGTVRTVTYERNGGALVLTDASTGQSRVLVAGLTAAQPLFLFHLADGSTVTGETPLDPRAVRSVTVQLQVAAPGAGRAVDLKNRVVVRNAD